jgi:hypothetical protein
MPIYSNRPRGPAGGDLSGSYPDPQVINLSGSATGSFTGSFTGDGASLTNILPNIEESHVVYVSSHSTDIDADGTLKHPFQTVAAALTYIGTQISANDPVLVNLLPGTYDSFTVTRHDTYFKSEFGRDRQRAAIVSGPIVINTNGAQKYNDIIGFEGIFFNTSGGPNSIPVVEISGSGKGLTYFDDCYIASSGSAECLKLNNTLTFANNKLVLRNTTFLGQAMGPDLLSINGGDAELDTCKFYYTSGPASSGSAIVTTGDTYLAADRCLFDIPTNDYALDLRSATSASAFTNCAVGSTGLTSPALLYTAKPLTLWNILFTANADSSNSKLSGSNSATLIFYSSLNSVQPLTASTVTLYPLTETHGTIVAASVTSSLFGTASYASSAATASYVNPLTQSVYIQGDLSASSGVTGSFSGSGAGIELFSTSSITRGVVPGSNNATTKVLKGDGTWDEPTSYFIETYTTGSATFTATSTETTLSNFWTAGDSSNMSLQPDNNIRLSTSAGNGYYLLNISGLVEIGTENTAAHTVRLKIKDDVGTVLSTFYISPFISQFAQGQKIHFSHTAIIGITSTRDIRITHELIGGLSGDSVSMGFVAENARAIYLTLTKI